MTDYPTRRELLTTAGAMALAGCSTGQQGEKSTTKGTLTNTAIDTPTETATNTPTELATDTKTEKETGTESESQSNWEIDPVEHDKTIGAYYYTWYRPEYGDTDKSTWTGWAPDEPVLGSYNSTDQDVINQHVKWAREHGINWFSISWARESGGWYDGTFIQDYFLPTELGSEIDFSVFYEGVNLERTKSREGKSVNFELEANKQKLHRDLGYLEDEYFDKPNYLTIDGRPVLAFYAAHEFENTADAFEEAIASLSADPFIIGAVLGALTRTGILHEVDTEATKVFDALTGYNLYNSQALGNRDNDYVDYNDYINWAQKELERWALAANHSDFDYVPTFAPGHNGRQNPNEPRPVVERNPHGFRELANIAKDRMDSDLDTLLITSFNEWPEYTAVEPSQDFGTTYLEIIKEELAQGERPDFFQPDIHQMLQLQFDRTVPAPKNPIEFGMMADGLETQNPDGEPVHSYDIGQEAEEPYMLEGAFPPKHTPDNEHVPYDHWRWLGGPTQQATIYLHPEAVENSTQAAIDGQAPPFADDTVGAAIYVNGTQTDHITLNPDPDTYYISLTG